MKQPWGRRNARNAVDGGKHVEKPMANGVLWWICGIYGGFLWWGFMVVFLWWFLYGVFLWWFYGIHPLVPWKITMFDGNTHYKWDMFNSELLNYQRVYTPMLHVWYISLHDWMIFRANVNVGKYSSTMEHMG